jgi:D-sedoheptulose 7-phosphate isomerase
MKTCAEVSTHSLDQHVATLQSTLDQLRADLDRIERWAGLLAHRLRAGCRLLAAGNGGSAAQAQHLTSELVGRYATERRPFSAIALHAETSCLTALANDYGVQEMFARQVRAHGRSGDLLLLLSTSGRSENLLHAARAAAASGVTSLALTGPAPNPLAELCDDTLTIDAPPPNVQEIHLVVIHLLCDAFDHVVAR